MEAGAKPGPYEILEQLGAGGMGEVWLAQDTRLGRKVAIKVLPGEFAGDPERLARFEQEARAAAALNHANIAAVHDVGVEDGTHFTVQEYLQGRSLRTTLEAGPRPLKRTLVLATEIAEALRAARRSGIVHRDLKPDNVFVSEDGHAKVLDFGLAKLTEAANAPLGSQTMSPTVIGTQAGVIMGTAGYMSPEQVEGREVDARTDLFAFGCVLYEMAAGRQPFRGQNIYETLGRIVSNEPEPLSGRGQPPLTPQVGPHCEAARAAAPPPAVVPTLRDTPDRAGQTATHTRRGRRVPDACFPGEPRPTQFRENRVFWARHEYPRAEQLDLQTTSESRNVKRLVGQQPEIDLVAGGQIEHVEHRTRLDGIVYAVDTQVEIRLWKTPDESLDGTLLELDDEVDVMGGPRLTLDAGDRRAGDHVCDAGPVECLESVSQQALL